MSKEYFTDNIKTETLARLIDETLRYEKNKKGDPMRMSNIIKTVSAVAAIVLVIGLINIVLPIWNKDGEPDTAVSPDDANSYVATTANPANIDRGELFLPQIIEKSFYEDRILAQITDTRALDKLDVYYTLKDPEAPDLSDRAREDILVTYPITKFYAVYGLDWNISYREKDQLLSYIYEYTDITRGELIEMCLKIEYMPVELDERYANVRFGDDYDTLLLDVEWHTYETWLEEIEEYRNYINEEKQSDFYINLSDEEKKERDIGNENWIKDFEELTNDIRDKRYYWAKSVNGKNASALLRKDAPGINTHADLLYEDSDGYYILPVYPYLPFVFYYDENGEYQTKFFDVVDSKHEYTTVMNNEIYPFCADLLARGLLSQKEYDYFTALDPLDYFVDIYFD